MKGKYSVVRLEGAYFDTPEVCTLAQCLAFDSVELPHSSEPFWTFEDQEEVYRALTHSSIGSIFQIDETQWEAIVLAGAVRCRLSWVVHRGYGW